MTETTAPGRRDRKRIETRARIEAAALDLVLRDGLEAATVDAISEQADISPRTFFNYFDSKDAALLGLQPHELDEEALAEHVARVGELDPLEAVVGLVMVTMGLEEGGRSELHARRVEVLSRHPEVVGGHFAQINARKTRMTDHTVRVLAEYDAFRDDPDLVARAGIVLALAASAVRVAVEELAGDATTTTPLIEQRAVALVHTTLEKLS